MNAIVPPVIPDTMGVIFNKGRADQYLLPARIDPEGIVFTEWEPTVQDLERLLQGGRVLLRIYTGMQPVQPVTLEVTEPECGLRRT